MAILNIRPKSVCRLDCIALGEVLLRLDPGDDRIHTARNFRVSEGGGEYNVVRNLSTVFGLDTAVVTALADNPIGRLAEGLIRQGGVDVSEIRWLETDGVGKTARNGLYFMERGFGPRSPIGASDRANTAISRLTAGEVDWQRIFGVECSRWFHTGGIFVGLSDTTPEVALEAMKAARENGSIVSYDLNYRESLWSGRGGRDAANALNHELLPYADIVFGVENFSTAMSGFDEAAFRAAASSMMSRFPDLKAVATTIRDVHSANRHDLGAACFAGDRVFRSRDLKEIDVYDRVGSGDAFAAGFIYGLMTDSDIQAGLEFGTANAALTMASPGDASAATLAEVRHLAGGRGSYVSR